MPTIFLPSLPYAREATPRLLTYGSKQRGILGGPVTPIERLGTRFAVDITMPPMLAEPNGRIWVARLVRAQSQEGVFFKWPQPDLDLNPATHSDGLVAAPVAANTATVQLKGLKPSQPLREGQFISLHNVATGRRSLHMIDQAVTAALNGTAQVSVTPRFRAAIATDNQVAIVPAYIEGLLVGDAREWNLDAARTTGLAFTIEERE